MLNLIAFKGFFKEKYLQMLAYIYLYFFINYLLLYLTDLWDLQPQGIQQSIETFSSSTLKLLL